MKADYLKKFKYRLFWKVILRMVACVVGLLIFLFFVDLVFNDVLADLLSGFSRTLYLFAVDNKYIILGTFSLVVVGSGVYSAISNSLEYLREIIDSIDLVFRKDEQMIELPSVFSEVQNKLNSIKIDMLRNEQLAKEAEQRKNDLVVYLAHDLKTPLTSVIGYLSLLNDEPEIPQERQRKYIAISLDKAERLQELIDEFFEITRFNLQHITVDKRKVNLSYMLQQMVDEFYPLLEEKGMSCQVQTAEGMTLMGDPDKLARVFDNLLRNAINYSDPNTTIQVQTIPRARGVEILFCNHGPEIPKHKLELIFEKFYRVDTSRSSKTGGAGLGLAIAKEIVELHGGTISAQSNPECTTFQLFLPWSAETEKSQNLLRPF